MDFKEWSQSKGFPKSSNHSNKNFKVDFKTLETFIKLETNLSNSEGVEITSLW